MAKTNPDTILIKGDSWVTHEADAAVALTPGEFVVFASDGDFELPAAGDMSKLIVIEDDLQGKGITDDYAIAANCRAVFPQPGSIVRAIIADGVIITIGLELEVNNAGHLIALASNQPIAVALEAVDSLSDSAATAISARRINVMVL